jgi:hypothetical protein
MAFSPERQHWRQKAVRETRKTTIGQEHTNHAVFDIWGTFKIFANQKRAAARRGSGPEFTRVQSYTLFLVVRRPFHHLQRVANAEAGRRAARRKILVGLDVFLNYDLRGNQ